MGKMDFFSLSCAIRFGSSPIAQLTRNVEVKYIKLFTNILSLFSSNGICIFFWVAAKAPLRKNQICKKFV